MAFSPRTYFHKYLAQQIPIPVIVHIELYLPLQLQECFDELTAFFRAVITPLKPLAAARDVQDQSCC